MPNALEARLSDLERTIRRRLDPSAEQRQRAAEALAAASASFAALEQTRSELRGRHRALLHKVGPTLTPLRRLLAELQTIEAADSEPYHGQWRATHADGLREPMSPELQGSAWLRDTLQILEARLVELERLP